MTPLQASEPEALNAKMSFQVGEQHLDFLAPFPAPIIFPRMLQLPDGLTSIFFHMSSDSPERRVRAGLSDRTGSTGFFDCVVALDARTLLDMEHWNLVPLKVGVDVAFNVILEIANIVFPFGLVLAIQHGDMRGDLAFEQPAQERASAI